MVSFQCSRHATPDGIINAFKQCASFQLNQDLEKFVSVVVLDEVGLAEDSENMPLKVIFFGFYIFAWVCPFVCYNILADFF